MVSPQAKLQVRRRPVRRFLFWIILVAAALSVPQVFRATIWLVLQEEVLRQGGELRVDVVQGSLWEPVVLSRMRMVVPLADGSVCRFSADRVRVECALDEFVKARGKRRFVDRVAVEGAKVSWRVGKLWLGAGAKSEPEPVERWPVDLGLPLPLPVPARFELSVKDAELEARDWALRAGDASLVLSELAPGEIKAARIELSSGEWSRAFREVRGKTAVQGDRIQLGDMQLMEGLSISSLSASLANLGEGRLDVELQLQAFGGELRALAQVSSPFSEAPLEASGTFSRLGVAPLAAFLNVTEAAGGTLEAGKFSFHGQPANPDRATASLRLEARNFQWETRQWDELVIGATLLDHRIQVPEFSLRQGHNQLLLNGDMQWPGGGTPWWQADFGVNVTARIENLTELSALLMPEFKYAAGGLTVDGAVRSQAGVLGGALIVSGANITWRNAPIEELHAALKLQGTEVQLLNVELTQGSDWVRGKGNIKVGEGWSYQGELHASVRDLGKYAALVEPPVSVEAYAGGVEVDWAGKGDISGGEGRMSARFSQLRPIRAQETWRYPLSGDFSGSYTKEGVTLETLNVGDGEVHVRTGVQTGKDGVRLTRLNVIQGQGTVLEGEALLPAEVLAQWPAIRWAEFPKWQSAMQCRFVAKNMNLALLAHLPGAPLGLEGSLNADWEMRGSVRDLTGRGTLRLERAAWNLGAGRLTDVDAELEWQGRVLRAKKLGWLSASGRYDGGADLEWKGEADPAFNVSVACDQAVWRSPDGVRFPASSADAGLAVALNPVLAKGKVTWKVSGGLSTPVLAGEAVVEQFDFGGVPDLRALWRDSGMGAAQWGGTANDLLKDWKLQLRVTSAEGAAVAGTPGAVRVDLRAMGTAGKPEWHGELRLALRGAAAGIPLEVEPLVLKFQPERSTPELEVRGKGRSGETDFSASAIGPLGRAVREYKADAPLSPESVRAVFEEAKSW